MVIASAGSAAILGPTARLGRWNLFCLHKRTSAAVPLHRRRRVLGLDPNPWAPTGSTRPAPCIRPALVHDAEMPDEGAGQRRGD